MMDPRRIVLSAERAEYGEEVDAIDLAKRHPELGSIRSIFAWIREDGVWLRVPAGSPAAEVLVHVPYIHMTGHEILEAHEAAMADPIFDKHAKDEEDGDA